MSNGDEVKVGKLVWEQMGAEKRGALCHCWHGNREVDVQTSQILNVLKVHFVACGLKPYLFTVTI